MFKQQHTLKSRIIVTDWLTLGLLCLALVLLTACRSASSSIKIKGEITPEPIVGQITILHVEVVSEVLSGDGIIAIQLSPGINLVEGELEWHGPVVAGEPFFHEVSICVLQPGQWGVALHAGVTIPDGEGGDGDSTRLHIISSADSAKSVFEN